MIFLGLQEKDKKHEVEKYRQRHGLDHIVIISADAFPFELQGADQIKYSDVIMYITFYRLLQEIDQRTLVVLNECLRSQNRFDLAVNCIRHFLDLTSHQIIFQQLPIIDEIDDFMILFDFDTRSRWKRRKFDPLLIAKESKVQVNRLAIHFEYVAVPTAQRTKERYITERERMFCELGSRDPHTLPRNLYMISTPDKTAFIDARNGGRFVARNQRIKRKSIVTYDQVQRGENYEIVDLPHRFIDFADFVRRTGQVNSRVLVADLQVEKWYFQRYEEWGRRLSDVYASLS